MDTPRLKHQMEELTLKKRKLIRHLVQIEQKLNRVKQDLEHQCDHDEWQIDRQNSLIRTVFRCKSCHKPRRS